MPPRALLIAFEEYPNSGGLMSPKLDGTHDLLKSFFDWLVTDRLLLADDVIVSTDFDHDELVRLGATRANMFAGTTAGYRGSVSQLITLGAGSTDELFVLYSGHGVGVNDTTAASAAHPPDCLLTVDFTRADPAFATYRLSELRTHLGAQLGPGSHYYFIDACRHPDGTSPRPSELNLAFNQIPGDPRQFTLFSTERGASAATDSGFGPAIVTGLRGDVLASAWVDQRFGVFWSSLRSFLKARTARQAVDSERPPDGADALLVEQMPPPTFGCTISCVSAGSDAFAVLIDGPTEAPVSARIQRRQSTTLPVTFDLPPGKFFVSVAGPKGVLQRDGALPGDNFFDFTAAATLTFTLPAGPVGPSSPPTTPVSNTANAGLVNYSGNEGTRVEIATTMGKPIGVAFDVQEQPIELGLGRYVARAIDRRSGLTVGDQEFELGPEGLDLAAVLRADDSKTQHDLRSILPSGPDWVDFSESLRGRVVDPDVAVWLALLGASRIVEDPQSFSKMRSVSLFDARESRPPSALYVLSDSPMPQQVQVASPFAPKPFESIPHESNIAGLWWAAADALEPGSHLLDVTVEDGERFSLATYTDVGRATLITLTRRNGRLAIGQYVLPIAGRESDRGDSEEALRDAIASHGLLWWILYSAQAQRAFARHQRLETDATGSLWSYLLYGKWVDPVMSVIAAHELIRIGQLDHIGTVVTNLRRHFPLLPDTEYLAQVVQMTANVQVGPPLILEAALGLGWRSHPFSTERWLDYGGPWTLWR